MKTLLITSAAISCLLFTSCGYTPSENAKKVALDAAISYLNHELNSGK